MKRSGMRDRRSRIALRSIRATGYYVLPAEEDEVALEAYTVALRELIEAKQEHRKPRAIEEAPPASNVINLMDALKRSVRGGGAAGGGEAGKRGGKGSARRTKRSRGTKAKRGRKRAERKAA